MPRDSLFKLYVTEKRSVNQIALLAKCSQNKINYWLTKHNIKKRSISDAIYQLKNPHGDPFSLKNPKNIQEAILFGMGLGLYWGEGAKRGVGGVRLGNTDAKLIKTFICFLETTFAVNRKSLRFGLQIFDDIEPKKALRYWTSTLNVQKSQFYKVIISKIRGAGTYKYKSENGVLMVYFNNTRLKALICKMIENFDQV
jgi:hypothetical protein